MKLLVIAQHVDETAPGRVFASQIKALTKKHDVSVISVKQPKHNISITGVKKRIEYDVPIFISKKITTHFDSLLYWLTGDSFTNMKLRHAIRKQCEPYDMVVAMCSMHNISALSMGSAIAAKTKCKFLAYFVDAIPTPKWWGTRYYYKGISRYIKRYSKQLDCLASANPLMLSYQKQFINKSCKRFEVLYTPPSLSHKIASKGSPDEINFVYTGNFYGLRNTRHLFAAFSKFIAKHPNAKLTLVGALPESCTPIPPGCERNIYFIEHVSDLTPFYERATALIDIDAEIDNDIFLSSKIANYIMCDHPIICLTGANSPARHIFSDCNSIIICGHNDEEICKGMETAINSRFDFHDRYKTIGKMNADKILELINKL